MSIALYMDENVHRAITNGLRLREVDVLTVQEDQRSRFSEPKILDRIIQNKFYIFVFKYYFDMEHNDVLRAFGIDINKLQNIKSLYDYAPVYHFNYEGQDYVLKRTGIRSDTKAIAAWTGYLVSQGIQSVAPVRDFDINPRCLTEKHNTKENWVIYPFITGIPYTGSNTQIYSAGKLLGEIHAVGMNTDFKLKVSETVIAIETQKIESEISEVLQKIEQYALAKLETMRQILNLYYQQYLENISVQDKKERNDLQR